ncbi:C6 transcription factor-like protein [Dothidotthia symphoricarpi CBS 119687]|uniref:C6 transcription factor-like protein n=1 Tax=Dothidotthia symphoricarpi CBS 119687 TaxID=1392245 RepID=A0A6A6ATB1_9PLEO|nr:C6 transcription factor-like protein [Dothidotthia symphoricarpi CBS 119687]KAF2134463.1 C6 transcription factor-like protein [Dothidotthia symphoricarpi CBS 119687]
MASAAPIQTRPYRSHKVPACTRCRSRKIRCHIDIPGEPCLSCRERRLKCQYVDSSTTSSPSDENGDHRPPKRRRLSNPEDGPSRPRSAPILHKTANNSSASIMLAPHHAEDVDIFNRHILQHRKAGAETSEPSKYQTLFHDIKDPVVYLTVPRFRKGLPPNSGCGRDQLEIVEQIIGPFKREVVELFINNIHFNFPVLDHETYTTLRNGDFEKLPNSLMCVIYEIGSPMWAKSDTLKMHFRPDIHYISNKGISAILEDFLSPGIPTVQAAILDQIARPSVSIVGNITLCGKTISLAQTFGLHRNPSKWNITDNEKAVRIRLWWCCLITDHWSSVAYGAPPHISKGYHDVPRPTVNSLITAKATPQQRQAVTCFLHLCTLTELLGDIHPLVYQIEPDRAQLAREIERLKRELNDLEAQLPGWLSLPSRPGSSNLWLCFLSIRLILARLTFRSAVLDRDPNLGRDRAEQLRIASSSVLDFILSLGEPQFQDFWLPYATQLLVHAVTVSLRCTVETQDHGIRNTSVLRLEQVMTHIQYARDNFDWDIANYCLERCSDPVSKIVALNARELQPTELEPSAVIPNRSGMDVQPLQSIDDTTFLLSDILDPNAFDFSWDALWDTPSGMTNFSI